jgi:hypothetical protein
VRGKRVFTHPQDIAVIVWILELSSFHHLKDKKSHYPFCVIHDYLSRFFPGLYLFYRKLWEGSIMGVATAIIFICFCAAFLLII